MKTAAPSGLRYYAVSMDHGANAPPVLTPRDGGAQPSTVTLIAGRGNTHVAMLVERHSRFTMLVKVSGKDSKIVVAALSTQVKKLPDRLRQSLTWDRGMELADHKISILATDIQCISVILEARGNTAPTNIRIGSFCNTFREERTLRPSSSPAQQGWRTS